MDSVDFVPHHKVVLLGNSGCGKTSIICRYISDVFAKDTKPTVGGNHQRKRVSLDGKTVDLFIWDTAGQERFQALMPLYARSSQCAIITTAINEMSSFRSVDQWIELVKTSCTPLPPIILAVNKMDDSEHAAMTIDEINSQFRDKVQGIFFVSALSGENIEQLFSFVAVEAIKFSLTLAPIEGPNIEENEKNDSICC